MSNSKWEENQRRMAEDAVTDIDPGPMPDTNFDGKIACYNQGVAMRLGLHAAILLESIKNWCHYNQGRGRKMHFKEGRWWVFNCRAAWGRLFPELSDGQIKRALKTLEDVGAVVSGEFNRRNFDKTKWYSYNGMAWMMANLTEEEKKALSEAGMDLDDLQKLAI